MCAIGVDYVGCLVTEGFGYFHMLLTLCLPSITPPLPSPPLHPLPLPLLHRPGPGMPPPGPGGGGGPPGPRPFSNTTSVLGKRQPGFLDINTKRSRIGGLQNSSGRGRGTAYSNRGRGRGTTSSFTSGRGRGSTSAMYGAYGRGGPSRGRGTYSSRGNRGGGGGYSSWNGQQAGASGGAFGGRKCSICRQEGEGTEALLHTHAHPQLHCTVLLCDVWTPSSLTWQYCPNYRPPRGMVQQH